MQKTEMIELQLPNTDMFRMQSTDIMELISNILPDMVWIKQIDGRYIYANKAICDGLLMAKQEEVVGKTDIFFAQRERALHLDDSNWHTFGELCFDSDSICLAENKQMRFEEYGNIKSRMTYLEVFKAPFADKDGNVIGTIGVGRDITKLKMLQLELEVKNKLLLEEQEKSTYNATNATQDSSCIASCMLNKETIYKARQNAVGEIVEALAHQWRQPLNAVSTALASLEINLNLGLDLEEKAIANTFAIANKNLSFLSKTIDDFRKFVKEDRNNQTVNFMSRSAVDGILSIFQAELQNNNIRLFNFRKCGTVLQGFETELKQSIMIIIKNAIDAIKLDNKSKNKKSIIIHKTSCTGDNLLIEISDNAGGINESIKDNIFELYFSTKKQMSGAGLGLFIAKRLIEVNFRGLVTAHNIVKNGKTRGAKFVITIPLNTKRDIKLLAPPPPYKLN